MSLARFSVNNRVLVNMLMLVILMAGGIFAFTLVREFFPESRPDKVMITAVYPGQQPEEVEKSVTIKVEEAVHDIEGIEKVDSTVSEGVSMTTLTLYSDVEDINVVVQEVKSEVDALADLPEDVERVTINKLEPRLPVISVALYGKGTEAELKRASDISGPAGVESGKRTTPVWHTFWVLTTRQFSPLSPPNARLLPLQYSHGPL